MLSDSSPRREPIAQDFIQPPLQPIPPTPSDCLPQTGGVDWSLIASCSPEEVAESNDVETLSAVIETFVRAEWTQTEAQLMPNPLTAKLFRLLQVATHYLLDCQTQLQTDLDASEKAVAMMKAKMKNMAAALARSKDKVIQRERQTEQTEKCVVCGRRFKNIVYLDGHMQRRHAGLVPAWRSLRSGQMQGMDEIMDQIEGLRQAVAKTHLELEKRKKIELPPEVSHVVAPTDQQIKMMNELAQRQEELLEQARMQEEKQQRFRQEIRNQLDEAVLALRQSQKQMLDQSQTIAKIPTMPDLGRTENVELEASLTGRLMAQDVRTRANVKFDLNNLVESKPIAGAIPEPPKFLQEAGSVPMKVPPAIDDQALGVTPDVTRASAVAAQEPVPAPGSPVRIVVPDADSDDDKPIRPMEMTEAMKRKMKQDHIMSILKEGEEEEEVKEIKPVLTKAQMNELLLRRAEELATRTIETDESHKAASILAITEQVLAKVDTELTRLKALRPYAPLSRDFVNRKMKADTTEYKQSYEAMNLFVASQVPELEDYRAKLFKERDTRFPFLPSIKIPGKKSKAKPEQGQKTPKIPELNQAALKAASKKIPYRQRQHFSRPTGLPGDSDVEVVSAFSSELDSSEPSINYLDDPDFYKPGHAIPLGEPEHMLVLSSDDDKDEARVIKPLEDMKQVDMNDFADLSSSYSDSEQVQVKPPMKKPQITPDVPSTPSQRDKTPELTSSSDDESVKQVKLSTSNASFNVTKRDRTITVKPKPESDDEMFNLSYSGIPSISSEGDAEQNIHSEHD